MKRWYQEKPDDCMRAAIASILEIRPDVVPHFSGMPEGAWRHAFIHFMLSFGATYLREFFNPYALGHGINEDSIQHLLAVLNGQPGIGGYFLASVYSPDSFNPAKKKHGTHMIIVDADLNLIHEPKRKYHGLEGYPGYEYLGGIGVLGVDVFNMYNKDAKT